MAGFRWKKYNINIKEVHKKNIAGSNLRELSEEYGIPKTTLNRYLIKAGYKVPINGRNPVIWLTKDFNHVFNKTSTICWKQALVYYHGYKCFVCDYDKIVEAHHIIPLSKGGTTTVRNGILLCPNHHAEVHNELLDLTEALVKLDELLENLEEGNQQPSCVCKQDNLPRDTEGSTTNPEAKVVMGTRASRSCRNGRKRMNKEEYLKRHPILRDMI